MEGGRPHSPHAARVEVCKAPEEVGFAVNLEVLLAKPVEEGKEVHLYTRPYTKGYRDAEMQGTSNSSTDKPEPANFLQPAIRRNLTRNILNRFFPARLSSMSLPSGRGT